MAETTKGCPQYHRSMIPVILGENVFIYSDNPAAAHYCFVENNFMTKIIVNHVNTQAHLQFQVDPNSSSGLVFLLDTREKKKFIYKKRVEVK